MGVIYEDEYIIYASNVMPISQVAYTGISGYNSITVTYTHDTCTWSRSFPVLYLKSVGNKNGKSKTSQGP